MLEISDLETGYGKKQVLFGATLEVRNGKLSPSSVQMVRANPQF